MKPTNKQTRNSMTIPSLEDGRISVVFRVHIAKEKGSVVYTSVSTPIFGQNDFIVQSPQFGLRE